MLSKIQIVDIWFTLSKVWHEKHVYSLTRLTVGTFLHMDNWGEDVENVNGFSRRSFSNMLLLGWFSFLVSGALNFGYYKVHPR